MPDYSVLITPVSDKTPCSYYASAYRHLRMFYAVCKLKSFSDDDLMQIKLALWKTHGKYLDLAWEHHFARQVASSTGKGKWHGWSNMLRFHQFWQDRDIQDFVDTHQG